MLEVTMLGTRVYPPLELMALLPTSYLDSRLRAVIEGSRVYLEYAHSTAL